MMAMAGERTLGATLKNKRTVQESPMLDFDNDNVIHMPTSVQTTPPEAVKTLEQARQRRREELADWQPSGGWLAQRDVARHAPLSARAGGR